MEGIAIGSVADACVGLRTTLIKMLTDNNDAKTKEAQTEQMKQYMKKPELRLRQLDECLTEEEVLLKSTLPLTDTASTRRLCWPVEPSWRRWLAVLAKTRSRKNALAQTRLPSSYAGTRKPATQMACVRYSRRVPMSTRGFSRTRTPRAS